MMAHSIPSRFAPPSADPIIRTKPFRARLRRDVAFHGQLLFAGGEVQAEAIPGSDFFVKISVLGIPGFEGKAELLALRDLEVVDKLLPGELAPTAWDWLLDDD